MFRRVEFSIRIQTDDLCSSGSGLSYTHRDGRVALDLRVTYTLRRTVEEVAESLAQRTDDPFKQLLLCGRLGWEKQSCPILPS